MNEGAWFSALLEGRVKVSAGVRERFICANTLAGRIMFTRSAFPHQLFKFSFTKSSKPDVSMSRYGKEGRTKF